MASNTGCTSVGDSLITFRISAVAVCCSSASCVSLNSRTFSMAITAWSAKVLSRLDLPCSSNGTQSRRTDDDRADRLACRAASERRAPCGSRPSIPSARTIGYCSAPCSRSGIWIRRGPRCDAPIGASHGRSDARNARSNCRCSHAAAKPVPPRVQKQHDAAAVEQVAAIAARWRRTPAGCRSSSCPSTRRTSAVAVCRSSASLVSLNSRTFSIAITAWSAKVCSSATCLSA